MYGFVGVGGGTWADDLLSMRREEPCSHTLLATRPLQHIAFQMQELAGLSFLNSP